MFRKTKEGVRLSVHLQPGAAQDEILGPEDRPGHGTVLKARVRAIPEKGRANRALCDLLAKSLGLPKSQIEVISGPKSRIKTVLIRGGAADVAALLKRKS